MDVGQIREKLVDAGRQITQEINSKYADDSITQWDELAAGKIHRLLDSIIANIDGQDVSISMDRPKPAG